MEVVRRQQELRALEKRLTRSIADQARTIRISVHMIETINKLNRARPRAPRP